MSELERLRTCIPINALGASHFQELAGQSKIERIPAKTVIFQQGDMDDHAIYLLSGEMELSAAEGGYSRLVDAESSEARYAMAQLRPRQFMGRAHTDAVIARVDSALLDRLLTMDHLSDQFASTEGYEVDEIDFSGDGEWIITMFQSRAFLKLPTSNIASLLSRIEAYPFHAGQVIIKQGESGDYYYVIKEGHVNVSRKLPDGKVVVLAELAPGDVFGEEALLSAAPRNASVIANSDGVLMRLAKRDFDELLKEPLVNWVTLSEAEALIKQGAALLDVRTPDEFRRGAIRVSTNFPLAQLRRRLAELDPDRKYIVCCQTGARSSVAAFLLGQRGFDVSVLRGGLQSLPKWPGGGG